MITDEQYYGLSILLNWYQRYNKQIIEVSGVIGTGIMDMVQTFISHIELEPYEVMYLTYNQKLMLELAYKKYHAFYTDSVIYKYNRMIDFDTLKVINHRSAKTDIMWEKKLRKKINNRYKMIVVLDSMQMDSKSLMDLQTFGIPIILVKDPMLIPIENACTINTDSMVTLRQPHPDYIKNPIVYFSHKVLLGEKFNIGTFDNVSIVPKKNFNISNIRTSDMNIVMDERLRNDVNNIYRSKILGYTDMINHVNEKVILKQDYFYPPIVDSTEENIKVFMSKGTVGRLTKLNKHAMMTKWVPCDFTPEFYNSPFSELILDRHDLHGVSHPSKQLIPDETISVDYAYALTPSMTSNNHWDKVTVMMTNREDMESSLYTRMLYTAFSKSRKMLTVII